MPSYDNIVLHDDVDVPDFKMSPHRDIKSNYRKWQTKNIHDSMDCYAVLPTENPSNHKFSLYRRHPPIFKWTNSNQGIINGEHPEDIIEDADHWRRLKYTGEIEAYDVTAEMKRYGITLVFSRGGLEEINKQTEKKLHAPFTGPGTWFDILEFGAKSASNYNNAEDLVDDVGGNKVTYNDRDIETICQSVYQGENVDIDSSDLKLIVNFYVNRTVSGHIPRYDRALGFNGYEPNPDVLDESMETLEKMYEAFKQEFTMYKNLQT
jgi:hypothetical protein